jgi:hypothetical protein
MSRTLDAARRAAWAAAGEPERPATVAEPYLTGHGDARAAPGPALGPGSAPPPGIAAAEWDCLDPAGQQRRRAEYWAEQAAAQLAWEARARGDYEQRREADGQGEG